MFLFLLQVLYVPDSQRGEGDDSSDLFADDVSPKSAPPELKTFPFPDMQKLGGDAAVPGGVPGTTEGGEAAAMQGDTSELGGA